MINLADMAEKVAEGMEIGDYVIVPNAEPKTEGIVAAIDEVTEIVTIVDPATGKQYQNHLWNVAFSTVEDSYERARRSHEIGEEDDGRKN